MKRGPALVTLVLTGSVTVLLLARPASAATRSVNSDERIPAGAR